MDDNGEPLVVYHGTQEEFSVFENYMAVNMYDEPFSEGFMFSDEFSASNYGEPMALFLNIKNLEDYRDKGKLLDVVEWYFDDLNDQTDEFYFESDEDAVSAFSEIIDEDGRLYHDEGSIKLNQAEAMWHVLQNKLKSLAEESGFDGFVINDSTRGDEHVSYCAFSPTQIKSATDNIGTFDPKNPDIRYQIRKNTTLPSLTDEESALRDALNDVLTKAGIEVITDVEEGQRVLDEANGEVRMMGSRVDGRMEDVGLLLEGRELGVNERAVVDVYSGKAKNGSVTVTRDGKEHRVVMRQGTENRAGTKHSLLRHYGTGVGTITADDLLLIPDVIERGEMEQNGKKRVYRLYKDGVRYTVITEYNNGREDFSDFYSNRKGGDTSSLNTQLSARGYDATTISATNVEEKSEASKSNGVKLRKQKINLYYNPRFAISPVRGEWTKDKIIRRLKDIVGAKTGYSFAARRIAEFDSAEELAEHMFYHGTQYGGGRLKPSILMSDSEIERIGGGGYGEKYWGVSLSKSKRVASNFSSVRIYPVILVKNAKVKDMPELRDAAELDDYIVDLWSEGVDAVWIGDKNAGEQELCVINPAAVVNIDTPDTYENYKLGTSENPLDIIDNNGINKLYEDAKRYVNALENKPKKPEKPSRFLPSEDGETIGEMKDDEVYKQELSEYEAKLDEYNNSEEARRFRDEDEYARRNIRFFRTKDGEAYGFTVGGKIYIDPRMANAETPVHEYTHLWSAALRENNPKEWKNIVSLMKGTGMWEDISKRYPELETDDEIADEVLAQYSGKRGGRPLQHAAQEPAPCVIGSCNDTG